MSDIGHRAEAAIPDAPRFPALRALLAPSSATRGVAALGMLALLAIGLHAGANELDDHAFVLLSALDRFLDHALLAAIDLLRAADLIDAGNGERYAFAAIDALDFDLLNVAARHVALGLELAAWAVLVPAIALAGREPAPVTRRPGLWLAAPLAALAAAVAGAAVLGDHVHAAVHSAAVGAGLTRYLATWIARSLAGLALLAALVYLALPAASAAERCALRLRARDRELGRRRARGLLAAFVALPVALVALIEGTSLIATLRALVLP